MLVIILVALLSWVVTSASAHEGHDLVAAEAATTAKGSPRLALNTENYELVAILSGLRLTIYLDRFNDNIPVTDAAIAVTINDETVPANPDANGTYTLTSGRFGAGGLFEFVFDVTAPEADDLLIGKLSVAAACGGKQRRERTRPLVRPGAGSICVTARRTTCCCSRSRCSPAWRSASACAEAVPRMLRSASSGPPSRWRCPSMRSRS